MSGELYFCNIPSLYGKVTRLKSKSRMIQEFDALYDAGWRGSVMAVDDNFVGNREAVRLALEEEVAPWQRTRGYPFQLHTQASVRVSDDPALLEAMYQAGFDKVFAGIESPVEESLKFMGAQKNLQGKTSLLDKVKVLQRAGFEVQAGFIMGLDTDPDDIADRMIAFIREAGIPVAMVGILGVLRDTPDYKRFKRLGRLVEGVKYTGDSGVFSRELSYVPVMDPEELIDRHRKTVEMLNSPRIFFERCLTSYQHRKKGPRLVSMAIGWPELRAFACSLVKQGIAGNYRLEYWKYLYRVLRHYPSFFPDAIRLAVQGHHLILTTQQALHADEVCSFLKDALVELENIAQGSRDAIHRAGGYASSLMNQLSLRFKDVKQGASAVAHNTELILKAAQKHCRSIRGAFGHLVSEPLRQIQRQVEQIEAQD
jgi:hypothetical protein